MGSIKEYVDRAVQTETDTVRSPYADPAVVLVAPPITRPVVQDAHTGTHHSTSASSRAGSDSVNIIPPCPSSPLLAPLVSRRLSRRRHARWPTGETVNRRIVSLPENKSKPLSQSHAKRVVSMPDRVRPVLEPSAELFQTPTATDDSFGSYGSQHGRIRIYHTPSDIPQTPSPPSSPESLLIIASGTQLAEGFLRRKYSPEPLIEEDEDWATWANSPPRPIPALHGPLSLPYARCPSGAEGTIIEEPDNVAQMIWGLGPDDPPHSQARVEGISFTVNSQSALSHGAGQAPPRLQKKRCSVTQQVQKSSRTHNSHASHTKQGVALPQRQGHDDKYSLLSQILPDTETRQDSASGLAWNKGQPMAINIGDNFVDDADPFPVDNDRVLERQLARLRQALRTSLADMDSYANYPGRLEPVIPAAVVSGLPHYPRIFVEPHPNESVNSSTRQSPIDIAQHCRQQQIYRQALQKQKLQIQNLLPTPPNSSSPQWSSHFSPYLAHCSTFSPELVGPTEHPLPVSSQKYWSAANPPQYLRHLYDRHELDNSVSSFDTNANTSSVKTSQIASNQAPSLRQSYSSSTLAKYIKQLQTLSPIAPFSPLQPAPPPNAPVLSSTSIDESVGPFRTVYHPPAVPTPPSPESPQTLSRGPSCHNTRSVISSRSVQRRLSSVPEEDSALLELSASLSPSRLQDRVAADGIASSHDTATGRQIHYVDRTRKSAIHESTEFENNLGAPSLALHEASSVKVRLPIPKEHTVRGQTSGHLEQEQNKGHQHGFRKKHRYKKLKGPAATNEQAMTRGLVG